jgi:phage tail sheath protein FI
MQGSYVEETHNGPRPIEGVNTGTAGFVGRAEKGVDNESVLITSWAEFVQEFGRYTPDTPYLAPAVCGFFENGGSRCFVVKTTSTDHMGADNGNGELHRSSGAQRN